MKIGKILILAMTICCLLIVSSIQVTALEKSETMEDSTEDVISFNYFDLTEEIVTENEYIEVDNIDITKVEYTITDETIEFSIEVAEDGMIEDRGSFDQLYMDPTDPFASLNTDAIEYSFLLLTSKDTYAISYVNNSCRIVDSDDAITNLSDSDFSVNDNVLTVAFDWDTNDETFEDAYAQTLYSRMILDIDAMDGSEGLDNLDDLGIVVLMDKAPNGPLYISYAEPDIDLAEVGVPVNFSGLAVDGLPPHEYQWEFGDGETSSEQNPTHTYDEAGEYDYTLTVTDAEGASESLSGSIEIVEHDDTNGTPGFEFIIAIMAIGFIFLWKRKR